MFRTGTPETSERMGEGLVCHRIYNILSTTQGYLQDRGGVWGVGVGGGQGSIRKDLCMGILLAGTGVALITEPCR